MIRIRRADQRGYFDHGWLKTYHTFSFGAYRDLQHMGFRALRVMNEDWVQPGSGFGTHGHQDMEIVTYVLEGALAHRDSMGNGSTLRPGEFQRMSAGTGIEHSEFNPSDTEPVHLYQIWLFPREKGLEPSYEQRTFAEAERRGRFQLVAGPGGGEALQIQQDVSIYLAALDPQQQVSHEVSAERHWWLQILRGSVHLQGQTLFAGDGVASDEPTLAISAVEAAEVMLFDLA